MSNAIDRLALRLALATLKETNVASEIKRYNLEYIGGHIDNGAEMNESETGDYVTIEDYEALRATSSAAADEVGRLRAELALYREGYEAFMVRPGHDRQRTCYEGDGWGRIRAAVKAIEDYTATDASGALTSTPPPPPNSREEKT